MPLNGFPGNISFTKKEDLDDVSTRAIADNDNPELTSYLESTLEENEFDEPEETFMPYSYHPDDKNHPQNYDQFGEVEEEEELEEEFIPYSYDPDDPDDEENGGCGCGLEVEITSGPEMDGEQLSGETDNADGTVDDMEL